MLASAIAAHLANASPLEDSVRKAKLFVFGKLQKNAAMHVSDRFCGGSLITRKS